MSSIMTNSAAMTALKSLQATNSSLESTQARISTGYKVGEASDNAAYWSIATTMRSDNKALGTVQDALGLGSAKVDVAYTGMKASISVVDEIKSKLVAAREPGVDKAKIQSEVAELQNQLVSISSSSSFSGENWLSVEGVDPATPALNFKEVVASFNRSSAGAVSVETVKIDTGSMHLFNAISGATDGIGNGLLDDDSTTLTTGTVSITNFSIHSVDPVTSAVTEISDADLDTMISGVDSVLQDMTTQAANLGAANSRISMQTEFVSSLMDSIDRGVGTLIDADMTKESTRLSALQTQQQLGTQALSIANSSSQSILSLFR